jgi:hypothetical protein
VRRVLPEVVEVLAVLGDVRDLVARVEDREDLAVQRRVGRLAERLERARVLIAHPRHRGRAGDLSRRRDNNAQNVRMRTFLFLVETRNTTRDETTRRQRRVGGTEI